MSRPKRTHKCRHCGSDFTWEQTSGSVRQHNLDGSLHYCGTAKSPDVPNIQTPVVTPVVTPEYHYGTLTPAPVDTTNKPEAGKPIYDLVRPYVLDDIKTGHAVVIDAITKDLNAFGKRMDDAVSKVDAAIKAAQVINHTVTIKTSLTEKILENVHKQQHELMECLALGENVLLVGPAGTGKTTAAGKAAEALGIPFYPISVGPQTSKSDFFGFTDVNGRPIWTVVRKAFVTGGLLLIDEVDASGAGALTYMNAILANGHAVFPADVNDLNKISVESKHKDFFCVAAANTYGHGGNRMYVGRNQLDAATLDRFTGIDWDYDTDLEKRIGASQMRYVQYIWRLREKQNELSIKAVFGTRKIIKGVKALDAGWPIEKIDARMVFFGISADDKAKFRGISY